MTRTIALLASKAMYNGTRFMNERVVKMTGR